MTAFNRKLHKWLKRKYKFKRVGYIWCRELETAKQQHYHYALIIDGHKVCYPSEILFKVKEIWEQHLDGSEYTPKNCFYNIKRNDYVSIQNAIWRISYLAKARGKGYQPAQTKNYGTSRIKPIKKRAITSRFNETDRTKKHNSNVINQVSRFLGHKYRIPSYRNVCHYLNQNSYKSSVGNFWTERSLYRMLQRNGYSGLWGLNKSD